MGLAKSRLIAKAGTSNSRKMPTVSHAMNFEENNPNAKSREIIRYNARNIQEIFR